MAPRSGKPSEAPPSGAAGMSPLPTNPWVPDLLSVSDDSPAGQTVNISHLNCVGSDGETFAVPTGAEASLASVAGLMAQSLAAETAERPPLDESGPLRALLNLADFGIVLLDPTGAVLFVNEHAQGILDAGTVLAPRRDRLQCAPSASRQVFEQALDAQCDAARKRMPCTASILQIPHPRGPGATLFKMQQLSASGESGHWVVAFIFDSERRRNNHLRTLRELYGLSDSEAKVAFVLADGCDIPEIAKRMKIATNTVRAHLRSAYSKTGTKKQAQLVSRICRDLLALESLLR